MMQELFTDWNCNMMGRPMDGSMPLIDFRGEISKIKELPPLPVNAQRLLKLSVDPLADANKLAEIIEMDPLLSAQLVRWAGSALYGYRGTIQSAQDAIARVLGFDFVINFALSLAALSPLRMPVQGQLGYRMFLLHGLASTRLMPLLNQAMPDKYRQPESQLYLAGMLHNIGFPLLGHAFGEQFCVLERLVNANPALSIFNLESVAFDVEHPLLGAWLMQAWTMPPFIIKVVQHHHNPNYAGEYAVLNQITFLNDCLLGQLDIGDGVNVTCPDAVYESLGLSAVNCDEILQKVAEEILHLNGTVNQLMDKS
jgi:HD-like signal output (HDOD) protein